MSNGTPFLISKLKFSYNKYLLDKFERKSVATFISEASLGHKNLQLLLG